MIKMPYNFRNADASTVASNYPEAFRSDIYACYKSLISDELGIKLSKYDNRTKVLCCGCECSCYCEAPESYYSTNINGNFTYQMILNAMQVINYRIKEKILHDDFWNLCKALQCSEFRKFENNDYSNNIKNYYGLLYELKDDKATADNIFVNYLERKDVLDLPHKILKFTIGDACNYRCKSCRDDFVSVDVMLNDDELNDIIRFISQYETLITGCMGEFFYKNNYLQIFKNDVHVKNIDLFSNGSIFNEQNFLKIHENNRKAIRNIYISIDAATEETYKYVRSPAWAAMNKNLLFLKELQKDYGFNLVTNYTISKYNYKEVIKFVDNFDHIFDKFIFNYARSVFDVDHQFDGSIPDSARTDITNTITEYAKVNPKIII